MTARPTADIVADLERWGLLSHTEQIGVMIQARDRLKTLQALLTLTAPTAIADELMELRLLAIEGAARELEVLANAAWLRARLPHGAP